jgi:chromosome segregation ATPase
MDAFWEWLGSPKPALPLPTTKVTSVNENNNSTVSFDRMRNMLTRAAEIRESEQQQIFDTLDEIHARLSPLESIGAVRKRLSEIPDRTDVTALASRVEDAMAKLESQDATLAALTRAVEGIVDKLATPFAQLDGRLDGVAGRFEGVAGRMDGLEDKLANIHRRIDALDVSLDKHLDKQDAKLDAIPGHVTGQVKERIGAAETTLRDRVDAAETNLRGRFDEVDKGMRGQLDGVRGQIDSTRDTVRQFVAETSDAVKTKVAEETESVRQSVASASDAVQSLVSTASDTVQHKVTESSDGLHANIDQKSTSLSMKVEASRKALQDSIDDTKTTVDGTERLEELAVRLEQVTGRLDSMTNRLDAVEDGFQQKIADMGTTLAESLAKVEGTLTKQPDTDSVATMVKKSNEESERRIGGHLDEAMATFAELMMGGGPTPPRPPATLPRQTARRRNGKPQKNTPREDEDAEVSS